MPELGKSAGGARTIAKTPSLAYRMWARSRRKPIANWELSLDKPYDTATKKSSALVAAANRSLFSEICVRNKMQVCAALYDLHKFFDTIDPMALVDALKNTQFPPIDAAMGYQMHVAPRVLQVSCISSLPIRVDSSILAGCIYSVPWVKALFQEGSQKAIETSRKVVPHVPHYYSTYVDDVTSLSAGYGPDVQNMIVSVALALKKHQIVKRKFVLSPKSTIVASDAKLALRVAKELSQYGVDVQVPSAQRDLGVMFTAGTSRCDSLSTQRIARAKKRTSKIIQVSRVCRAARKLFVSRAMPQATWGHQIFGFSPSKILTLRRMAASTTGIS